LNLNKLYEILHEATCQLRKGEEIEGTPDLVSAIKSGEKDLPGGVVEIYAMPHQSEARPDLEKVDCEFVVIGVDKAKAEQRRMELIELLDSYPEPERLAGGPSYIEVGAEIGDQGATFQLFALGKVLGLWSVITPATIGITGPEARQLAGSGFVMMSGYRAAA
jgi:hypothetical protein